MTWEKLTMEENENTSDKLRVSLSLSTDTGHFLRRECPLCGQTFKTQSNEAAIAWLIAPQIRQMGLEIGEKDNLENDDENILYCPYCDSQIEANNTLTEETVKYIQRYIMREIVLPMTNKALARCDDLSGGTGGFLSINFQYSRGILPPRPIHGPDPSDMVEVSFLCCGKKAKISEKWTKLTYCIYCGARVQLV